MRYLILLVLSFAVLLSCQDDDASRNGGIWIRVDNRTDTDLRNVIIFPESNNDLAYATVSARSLSGYQFTETGDDCSFGYSMVTEENDIISRSPPACAIPAPLAEGVYRLVLDDITVGEQRVYFATARFERE